MALEPIKSKLLVSPPIRYKFRASIREPTLDKSFYNILIKSTVETQSHQTKIHWEISFSAVKNTIISHQIFCGCACCFCDHHSINTRLKTIGWLLTNQNQNNLGGVDIHDLSEWHNDVMKRAKFICEIVIKISPVSLAIFGLIFIFDNFISEFGIF